jgi:FAD/FMN-containing dehydrogenase/Fe-S oxidoreductase
MSDKRVEKLLSKLKHEFGLLVKTDLVSRTIYATDASMFELLPIAIITPKTTIDVKKSVQICKQHNISLTARGAGTGLAGESLDHGVILDFSLHMNHYSLTELNEALITIEPGVIHQELNDKLSNYNLIFGPDPATSGRCTLGGMISNNSTGAHSLKYGMTRDWIQSLEVILDDGSIAILKEHKLDSEEFQSLLKSNTREAEIYQKIIPILRENKDKIKETWPATPRNRHGYLLKDVLTENTIHLAKLFCGSEGTLGIITQATLKVAQKSKNVKLCCLHTSDRFEAAKLTPLILKSSPSALELIDEVCIQIAKDSPNASALLKEINGALMLVEFAGDSPQALNTQISLLNQELDSAGFSGKIVTCNNKESYHEYWKIRKHVSAVINQIPDKFQPIPIIEDVCVPPENLYKYFNNVHEILSSYGIKFLSFGHAGDGTAHIRPFLNIQSISTFEKLPELCSKFYDMCISLGASISGEHGDGLLRAPFMEKQYGSLVEVFKEIKSIFDPDNIFNPMKKTGFPDFNIWHSKLRYLLKEQINFPTILFKDSNDLKEQVMACNGCGSCRTRMNQDMCPVFRLFGEEISAPRTKANLWRAIFKNNLNFSELSEALEYCLGCGMCTHDCPAGVDSGMLVSELRAQLVKQNGQNFTNYALSLTDTLLPIGAPFSAITNKISNLKPLKKTGELCLGFTAERDIPTMNTKSWTSSRPQKRKDKIDSPEKVAIFADTFANWFEHEILDSFIKILDKLGIYYEIPKLQTGCGIVPFNYGNSKRAREMALKNMGALEPFIKEGFKIVCTEPTAIFMFKEKYPYLLHNTYESDAFQSFFTASQYLSDTNMQKIISSTGDKLAYHAPCHLKSIAPILPAYNLMLKLGFQITNLNSGCCGMAGTYGMKKEHYHHSLKIGNKLNLALNSQQYDYALSECSTCRMQIKHIAPQLKCLHPLVYLANLISRA